MGERKGTKALELWCRRMTEGYPGVKIDNMTTSWRDGLAFCAMIHHFRPDLIDFDKLNKEDIYYNNDLAFRTAERHLGIPALLDAVDMASYEVPDRLSILTYLAQFYQVFAAQDASNRLNNKRTANVVEKNSITKPTGPPPKMAHVVGVPKREPCQKCSMPVFLAERLTVGKKVYHRTCLKCARCGTQLTPGSFYETEIDGEYCCETCPDEEKSLSPRKDIATGSASTVVSNKTNTTTDTTGSSGGSSTNSISISSSRLSSKIADRLAFFENARRDDNVDNSSKRLLQKSLSDEEKSQSLKKFEENQKNAYQMDTAFNNFLSSHYAADVMDSGGGSGGILHNLDGSVDISRRDSAVSTTTTTESSSSSDEDTADDDDPSFDNGNDNDIPPELPKSLPPNNDHSDNDGTDDISSKQTTVNISNTSLKSFAKTTENKSNTENDLNNTPSNATLNNRSLTADDKLKIDDDDEHNIEQKDIGIEKEQISVTHNNDDLKNSVNVAKDSSEDLIHDDNNKDEDEDEKMRINQVPEHIIDIDSNKIINKNEISKIEQNDDNNETKIISEEADNRSNVSNMVRARLHQFENIANNKISSDNTTSSIDNDKCSSNKSINSFSTSSSSSDNRSNNNNNNNNDNDSSGNARINSNVSCKKNDDAKLMSIKDNNQDKNELHDENEVPKNVLIHLTKDDDNNDNDDMLNVHVQKKEIIAVVTECNENASYHNGNSNNATTKNDDEIEKIKMVKDQENEENKSNKEISMGIVNGSQEEKKENDDDNHNAKEIEEQIILSSASEKNKNGKEKNEDIDDERQRQHYTIASNDSSNHDDDNVDLINAIETTTATARQQQQQQQEKITDHNVVVNVDDCMNADNDDNAVFIKDKNIQENNTTNNSNSSRIYRKNFISTLPSSFGKSATLKHKTTLSPEDELKNKSYTMRPAISTSKLDEYPEELDPFKSDNDDDDNVKNDNEQNSGNGVNFNKEKRKSLNPFDDENDDESDENAGSETLKNNKNQEKLKPPRPPPPKKISTNPFGSESEDDEDINPDDGDNDDDAYQSHSVSSSGTPSKRTPVPTPRNHLLKSQNPTPEPTPRVTRQSYGSPLHNHGDYYGSQQSLSPINAGSSTKTNGEQREFIRAENCRGSTHSLTSSASSGTGTRRKTKKAPAPPPPPAAMKTAKELFPTVPAGTDTVTDSKKSSPNSSNAASPKPRKKRPAPVPPPLALKKESIQLSPFRQQIISPMNLEKSEDSEKSVKQCGTDAKFVQLEKLSDEEKVLLENSTASITTVSSVDQQQSSIDSSIPTSIGSTENGATTKLRLIALDASLIEDSNSSQDIKLKEEDNVVYRRKIMPDIFDTPFKESNGVIFAPSDTECEESHDRQLEKLKDNKEAKNRNRQSHISLTADDADPLLNKSVQGKWKRRKGPAPALPVPPRKVLQMLPLQEIRHELEVIEVQQQGLEKQGVMLEKMIRDRCEGQNAEENSGVNSKEVEDLILQLFELVNEKNELFRRQAELMYLRRQHRLEQEQADLEYEIRVLMAQPERNKTDSDKAREESLIARLIEVVQLRNEVIECLEMDRLREAEEDMVSDEKSIKQRLEMHTAKRDEELSKQTPTKLSKKEKKKQKELKKLVKCKKLDADKDADESELNNEKLKIKKKKKKFLF